MCERVYTTHERTIINNFKLNHPHICEYCGDTISYNDKLTVDHKIPISRGGKTEEDNLVIACLDCNHDKADMTVDEYIIYKEKQQELLKENDSNLIIEELYGYYNKISERFEKIKSQQSQLDKEILRLQNEIMNNKFNACEGYKFAKRLSNLLKDKENIKNELNNFYRINQCISPSKNAVTKARNNILTSITKSSRAYLMNYAKEICKANDKSNVIQMNEYMEAAR